MTSPLGGLGPSGPGESPIDPVLLDKDANPWIRVSENVPSETVRKVSETLPAEPNGSPRSGFSVHFVLRIAAKSSLGLLLVPFSDSLSQHIGEEGFERR